MKRSFAEIDSAKNEVNRTVLLQELNDKLASMEAVTECSICVHDIKKYYENCAQITELNSRMQVHMPS